ncbi:MAG TPA: FAD-binding oxidoreductase [Fimbriimonadaceae bacterium]|nr:FAD-binding oxidoreductase [Fimbriimonadaceae bacterium]
MRRLSGFGRNRFADGYLYQPESTEDAAELLETARRSGRRIVLRGSGRSYGDAAIAAEQIVLDIRRMNRVLSWDPASGLIDAEAGATLGDLWRHTIADGYWLPVVSGTMAPTLAGALAMNIHGKNSFKAGTLGEHVAEMEIVTTRGETRTLEQEDPDFRRIISGAGLLAVITRVRLRMARVPSGDLLVTARSCRGWDEQFACFDSGGSPDYMVSWVDCFSNGRGLFHSALYDPDGRPPKREGQELPLKIMGAVPKDQVWRLLRLVNNRSGMRAVNTAKYLAGRREDGKTTRQSLSEFSFLLDYVPGWELAYQPFGFIQYQSFVPKDRAQEVFARQVEMARRERMESFLAVLKRHRPDDFMFSHGVDGYSLALDFKLTERARLWALCHRMNELVLEGGGRFYFAKDSTLRPADVQAYLGEKRLNEYREAKARLDPDGLLTSALAERCGLT